MVDVPLGNGCGWRLVRSEEETSARRHIWNKEHIKQQLAAIHGDAKVFLHRSVQMKEGALSGPHRCAGGKNFSQAQ